jgi:uncharacterized protein YggT (Ycf19 family)
MTDDRTLEREEQRRMDQYDAVQNAARDEIEQRAREQARHMDREERAEVVNLSERAKGDAISEIEQKKGEVHRARGTARVSQVIDYIFYLIYVIIGVRIVFDLFGAREGSGFTKFIEAVSMPFLAPFQNLFPDPARGQFQLRFSFLAALGIYIILHVTINGFLRMLAHRKTAV